MKRSALLLCLSLLLGCGASKSSNSASGGGSTNLGNVPLNQTIFMGDAITQEWSYAISSGNSITVTNGKIHAFYEDFSTECDSGCTPSELQTLAPGKSRIIILVGSYDAQAACAPSTTLDSELGAELDDLVRAAAGLYNLQVVLGTIPNLYNSSGAVTCTTQVAAVNQAIEEVATEEGITVLDFNSLLSASADFTLTSDPYGIYLPNTAGYTLMQNAYTAVNQ